MSRSVWVGFERSTAFHSNILVIEDTQTQAEVELEAYVKQFRRQSFYDHYRYFIVQGREYTFAKPRRESLSEEGKGDTTSEGDRPAS